MVRPLKEIDWDIVEDYIEAGCSGVEIASRFRIDSDTFYRRFKDEYHCNYQDYAAKGQESGKARLKQMLHFKALDNDAPGNATLLIFLARCQLGLKEPETVHLLAANQEQIDQSHIIMQLQHRIAELEGDPHNPEIGKNI
jgi:hypothetical protein